MRCIQDSCDSWDIVEQQGRQGGRQVQEVQEVHLQEGEGSTCGATQVNPAQPPIGQLASLSCALIGRHRCGVAQAAIPGLRALSLSGGEDRARWPNEQLLFTLVTASQQCRSKRTGVGEYPGSYIRSGPNAGMGGREARREVYGANLAFRPVCLIRVQ